MDSGGDAGLGGSRRKARTKLRKYVALGGAAGGGPGKTRRKQGGDGGGTVTPGPVLPLILPAIDDAGVTDEIFTAPELIYYLEKVARFIQKTDDVDALAADFGVRPDSIFAALQRKVRQGAPGNTASGEEGSDSHKRALDAFQSGSSRWAREQTKAKDVLVVTVKLLATAVQRNPDAALLSAPRAILEDYVEQVVVGSFLGGDPVLASLVAQARREYKTKLDAFFGGFNKPGFWVESNISKTMESFPQALR